MVQTSCTYSFSLWSYSPYIGRKLSVRRLEQLLNVFMYVPFTSFVQVSSRFIFCLFNEKTREQFVVKRATFKTKVTRKQGMPNFPKKEHFLHPHMHTYVCASEGKKCSSSENLALCFLVTSVLRFAILPYYRRIKTILQVLNYKREQGSADNPVFCERMSLRSFKSNTHLRERYTQFLKDFLSFVEHWEQRRQATRYTFGVGE